MKTSIIAPVLGLFSVLLVSCSKPEDEIVDHLEKVESIMKSNMDSPEEGLERLIRYFEKNGAEATSLIVGLGIELAKIEGNGDREVRAKEIQEAFDIPLKNLEGTAKKFGYKVDASSEARKLAEEYEERWSEVFKTLGKLGDGGLRF